MSRGSEGKKKKRERRRRRRPSTICDALFSPFSSLSFSLAPVSSSIFSSKMRAATLSRTAGGAATTSRATSAARPSLAAQRNVSAARIGECFSLSLSLEKTSSFSLCSRLRELLLAHFDALCREARQGRASACSRR